ncbi:phosphoglycerol transferase [Bifidobacterium moukalabense DSM 27321]|uniref:Phosphoglycerol transferase n=2 Tax=Bifidobacterium moukalabense TaxID=1333651 RepID=W4NB61_9BIFI|nr:phosphoglycerol transferase [Bifidobacterium moukalabense DSM 27321]
MQNILATGHSKDLPYLQPAAFSKRPEPVVGETRHRSFPSSRTVNQHMHISPSIIRNAFRPADESTKRARRTSLFVSKRPIHASTEPQAQHAQHRATQRRGTRYSLYTQGMQSGMQTTEHDIGTVNAPAPVPALAQPAANTASAEPNALVPADKAEELAVITVRKVHTVAHTARQAARRVAATVHHAAEKVHDRWQAFTDLKPVRKFIDIAKMLHGLWRKRMKFSYAFYTVVFMLLTSAEVIFLQWGMCTEPEYAADAQVDDTTRIMQSVAGQLTKFVSQMWLEQKYIFLVNFVGLGLVYLALIFITNRFWIATIIFGTVMTTYGVANSIKVQLRNEPIIPADLTFVSGGDTGSIMSFVPETSEALVQGAIHVVIWFVVICVILFALDGRRRFIHCSWRHPIANVKNIVGNSCRVLAAVLSVVLLGSYTAGLSTPDSWSYTWATDMGYRPELWNSLMDAQNNGPATTFLSLTKVKAMDKPENYSQKTMEQIAERYSAEAETINQNRGSELTDSTVILILSESFSDPTRVPGVSFGIDPMPNIRNIKNSTTSGLMLSPGYGGGTANIEYQALTGMNLANFNDSLIVPYQQLVPNQDDPYSFNQIWTQKYGESATSAVHPFQQSMYLRNINYKKFKFSNLYTCDSKEPLAHTGTIDRSPYVSDSEAYQNVLDLINEQKDGDKSQFLQLVTMQNHMPYGDYYDNNEFVDADTSENISDSERSDVDTYAKGVNYTDQETADFLDQLNQIDKPITVIFYGDHLPGIYYTADKDKNNKVSLHETDYFIWSNNASASHDTKLDQTETAYTSSNYFMAMAAEHMNAKVSPFLAMLTELHQEVPAMSRVIDTNGGIGQGHATYLDRDGNTVTVKHLSERAKQLLADYKLVQYDQTSGKNYLKDLKFTQVP